MRYLTILLAAFWGAVVVYPQANIVDSVRLSHLVKRGQQTHSDAVIVIQNGKILAEEYYGNPKGAVYIASAGKSLVSLAVGKLINDGKIKSLDQPVSDFYPEWLQGNKKIITIRMLMNHTSGIQNVPNASIEIERKNPPVNAIKLALAAELSDLPGANFSYNNKAVALLGGIIEKASGKKMDTFFVDTFFKPMNINQYDWIRDEDGNPAAYGAFLIEPMGLAKFGLMMLNNGSFEGNQILSPAFVEEIVKPSQSLFTASGLLWWRYPKSSKSIIDSAKYAQMRKDNIDADFLTKIASLENVLFDSDGDYIKAIEKTLGNDWQQILNKTFEKKSYGLRRRMFGNEIIGYYASGFRGNYLLVMPEVKLVAVRVVRNDVDYNWETDGFEDFLPLAAALISGKTIDPPVK